MPEAPVVVVFSQNNTGLAHNGKTFLAMSLSVSLFGSGGIIGSRL